MLELISILSLAAAGVCLAVMWLQQQQLNQTIAMKLTEVAANVNAAVTQIRKGTDEVVAKIEELKKQLADVELDAEATAALANLGTAAQTLDDIVPDAPPATPAQS